MLSRWREMLQRVRHQCVHFLATDAHRAKSRPPILSRGRDAAAEIVGKEDARKLVEDNPLAVISGKPFATKSPISFDTASSSEKRSIMDRLRGR